MRLLLLLPLCSCEPLYTVFLTADTYSPNATKSPDTICAESDGESPNSFEYRAVVTLSNRRNLSELFIPGYEFANHGLSNFTTNFSDIFNCSLRIYATNGTHNRTLVNCFEDFFFWAGWPNLSTNCMDFTTQAGNASILELGMNVPDLGSCRDKYHYLCVRGDNFSIPPRNNDVVVFLSADTVTPSANAGAAFDPDEFCQTQAKNSPFYLLNNASEVQAVAFTAQRQNLSDMFNNTYHVFNLDGDRVSNDGVAGLFQAFERGVKDSNGDLKDNTTKFWTGAGPHSVGVTCGDYTGGTSLIGGGYGTPELGISADRLPCNQSAHFLCAANVNRPSPAPSQPDDTLVVFFSHPVSLSTTTTPDQVCEQAASSSTYVKKLIGVFALTSNFSCIASACPLPLEDLDGNFLGTNLASFLAYRIIFTTRSLTTANGTHIDIDEPFWFSNSSGYNCDNFTSATAQHNIGRTLWEIKTFLCNASARFLCAATAVLVPTPAPTPPTAAPSGVTPQANGTYTGNGTVVIVGGNGTNGTIQVIVPSNNTLPNGTVVVTILGNNNNTIGPVVSVVFLNDTGDQVDVKNLTNPITLTFPIQTSLDEVGQCVGDAFVTAPLLPQCGYRNEDTNKWETDGCTVSAINASFVRCSCTHLTDFAVLAPKSNKVIPTDILELTPDNIAAHSTGLIAVMVILAIFAVVFALAWRRDRIEEAAYVRLRDEKQVKWADFAADKKKAKFVKQLKIAFQKRHTWFSLIFRKTGTSFKSVDRTFVALLTVFSSMSMSALFHAQTNTNVAKAVAWILTVCVCLVPSQILMALFVRTGEMGFYEEWEYVTARRTRPRNKCCEYRFPEQWRYVWRAVTLLAVIGMIVSVLTMSMRFDLQPMYYCLGEPAKAWVVTWLSAYAITVFGYEPLRLIILAAASYFMERNNVLKNVVEMSTEGHEM